MLTCINPNGACCACVRACVFVYLRQKNINNRAGLTVLLRAAAVQLLNPTYLDERGCRSAIVVTKVLPPNIIAKDEQETRLVANFGFNNESNGGGPNVCGYAWLACVLLLKSDTAARGRSK